MTAATQDLVVRTGAGTRWYWPIVILSGIAAIGWSVSIDELYFTAPEMVWAFTGGAGLAVIATVKAVRKQDFLSPAVMYMVVFWMFHFGLVFPAAFVPEMLEEMPPWAMGWLFHPETGSALVLCVLFMLAFALGGIFGDHLAGRPSGAVFETTEPRLVRSGWGVLAAGVLLAGVTIVQHGATTFTLPYVEVYAKSTLLSWTIVLLAYGLILQLAGGRSLRAVTATLVLTYLPCAIVAFLSGIRTAPLFTGVVLLVMFRIRGLRVPRLALWVSMIAVLFMISTVRELREYGMGGYKEYAAQRQGASPLLGLTEMGGSLRPVGATINYLTLRDSYHGETYLLPFERMAGRVLGVERANEYDDDRFIATWINQLYGSIGFSTVAEAYANGAVPGVFLFALAWGIVLGVLSAGARSSYGLALLAVALLPMMVNIRNSFIYVPGWVILGAAPLALTWMTRRRKLVLRREVRA